MLPPAPHGVAPAPQFGLQRAIIVSASLCEAVDRARGSVAFTFAHQETGRNMHGALAAGSVRLLATRRLSSGAGSSAVLVVGRQSADDVSVCRARRLIAILRRRATESKPATSPLKRASITAPVRAALMCRRACFAMMPCGGARVCQPLARSAAEIDHNSESSCQLRAGSLGDPGF